MDIKRICDKMIDVNVYLKVSNIKEPSIKGGQELIYSEIVGCLKGFKKIYLPFPNEFLIQKLKKINIDIVNNIKNADCIYFGTPTIVNNKCLFDNEKKWTKNSERQYVRKLCKQSKKYKIKKIVCGLGSGDISVKERIYDIYISYGKKPKIVCMKNFGEFKDWVLEVEK